MIKISERATSKLPGITSLFISFNYNKEYVDKIKTLSNSYNFDKKAKEWEFPLTSLSSLLDYFALHDDVDIQLLPDTPKKNEVYDKKGNFKTKLFDYQEQGVEYGITHPRWLLLDSPGLGKSITAIYIAQELKRLKNIEHCLIICGVNTLKTNWIKEIKKHSDLSACILGQKISRRGNVSIGSVEERLNHLKNPIEEFFVITNIETLRSDDIVKEILSGKNNKFDMMVVDEIHTCASPTSQQSKGLLKLTKAPYRIGMTGTLLTNNPLSAFVPLKWIGAENGTYTNFKYYYCVYGGLFGHDLLGFQNMNVLKDQLEKYSLRRTKGLLNLPPKTVINEYVDMNPQQYKFYNDIKKGVVDAVDKVTLDTSTVLSLLTRLRQATACPAMLTTEDIPSSKIDRAVDLTSQICSDGNSKVVIFSTYKETCNHLMDKLKEFNPLLCTGDVNDMTISKNVDAFQLNNINKVLVCTWSKLGTGVTLNRASTAIFIDTPWTHSQMAQAEDRVHRIGSKNNVTIYNLICNYTVDERVNKILNDKELMSEYIIDDKMSASMAEKLKEIILDLDK